MVPEDARVGAEALAEAERVAHGVDRRVEDVVVTLVENLHDDPHLKGFQR